MISLQGRMGDGGGRRAGEDVCPGVGGRLTGLYSGNGYLDSVEVWREDSRSWQLVEERLPKGQQRIGAVAVHKTAVCPP